MYCYGGRTTRGAAVKLTAKSLLVGRAPALWLVSFAGIVLRWASVGAAAWGVWAFYQADAFDAIVRAHGSLTGYAALYAAGTALRLTALTFAAALRGGETAVYAEIAAGGRLRLKRGLRFLAPKRAFRLLDVYLRVYALRLLWLLYFFIPALAAGFTLLRLNTLRPTLPTAWWTAAAGTAILAVLGILFWIPVAARFSAAPLLAVTDDKLKARDAVRESVRRSDGLAVKFALFRASLLGWALLCPVPFASVYCLPYCRLAPLVWLQNADTPTPAYIKARAAAFRPPLLPPAEE